MSNAYYKSTNEKKAERKTRLVTMIGQTWFQSNSAFVNQGFPLLLRFSLIPRKRFNVHIFSLNSHVFNVIKMESASNSRW